MNADLISVLYSGTPAMKTDFTLLGKRTVKGTVMDLVYGVKRWFLGNFYDSYTQDMIDVSVGKLKPKREKVRKPLLNIMFVIILLVQVFATVDNRSSFPGLSHGRSSPGSLAPPSGSSPRICYTRRRRFSDCETIGSNCAVAGRGNQPVLAEAGAINNRYGLGGETASADEQGHSTQADPKRLIQTEGYRYQRIITLGACCCGASQGNPQRTF